MAKPRVLISSDIGGSDPDDNQAMTHALLHANDLNIVGFVSTPTGYGGRTSHIHKALDAYAKDYKNLKTWDSDFPDPNYLKGIVHQGAIHKAPSKGWDNPTAGSKAIIKAAHAAKADGETLWVLLWGSSRDLAQALHDDPSIKKSIKVYNVDGWNGKQEPNARAYIHNHHKDLWMIDTDSTLRGVYLDSKGGTNNGWKMSDAKGHGAIGDYFYKSMPWTLKMGDAPSTLYLLDKADNNNPTADSWGGAFVKSGHSPTLWVDNPSSSQRVGPYNGAKTILKHQDDIYKDFVQRFDWAKAPKPGSSNGNGNSDNDDPVVAKPAPQPKPQPKPDTPSNDDGKGNPVIARDDHYKIDAGEDIWFAGKYLIMNDKAKDGGLKFVSIADKSEKGATVQQLDNGAIVYKSDADFSGTDRVEYVIRDKDGSTDTASVVINVKGNGNGNGNSTKPEPKPETPAPSQPETPPPSDSGKGHPVVAGDDRYKVDAGEDVWFAAKYLIMNDKGKDGGIKIASIEAVSDRGVKLHLADGDINGPLVYEAPSGFDGIDKINYTLVDKNGSTDTGTINFHVNDLFA